MTYYTYSEYLKEMYGEKVYKLPVGLPLTCPNRDGCLGRGGCTFCGEIGAGYENLPADMTVTEQLLANKAHIQPKYKAEKFIAYFQNFSNTYLPLEKLRAYMEEACQSDVVGIAIATRPDCISDEYLTMFNEVKTHHGVDITVELGLQSVNYHSLCKVNRGHTLAEFVDAVRRIQQYDFTICAHLILNLPWDDMTDVIEAAKMMSALQIDQVKLHALYIVKGTPLADEYASGKVSLISCEEYMKRVIAFLSYLDQRVVVQRLIGRAPAANTLFSNWQTGWWKIRDTIVQRMEEQGLYQGCRCDYLNGRAVRKFIEK